MPTKYRVPPARRPNPVTDDHSQPIAPPPRYPGGGGNGGNWVVLAVIVVCAALLLGALGTLVESLEYGTIFIGEKFGVLQIKVKP